MIDVTVFLRLDLLAQIHVIAALGAVGICPFVLWRRRRDGVHRGLGYVWVGSMVITALSSFGVSGIRMIGPFSPLHLLAVLILATLAYALWQVWRGNITAHRAAMRNLATFGLGLPLVMTFLPGRWLSKVVFPEMPLLGFVLMGTGFIAVVLWRLWLVPRRGTVAQT